MLVAALAAVCCMEALAARPELWIVVGPREQPGSALVAGSVAWLAESDGALCDSYFEVERKGGLFAENGSTVIGGRHFQDFNYLCAVADVKLVRYGRSGLFDSSARRFGLEVLADAETATELYAQILAKRPQLADRVAGYVRADGLDVKRLPYLFPEVAYARRLFLPKGEAAPAGKPCAELAFPEGQSWADFTRSVAEKWKGSAKCVFFGDPGALDWRVPAEIRRKSVALYSPYRGMKPNEIRYSAYTESKNEISDYAAELACALGDRVIWGRQTCDGDIFNWSKYGCCVQIIDPYRPTFPSVDRFPQRWQDDRPAAKDDEPTDEQLRQWAKEGRILTTLIWHSGEVAHNEAMLNVIEFAQLRNFKMGVAVHAQRYETCPQLWELLSLPQARGGAAELIEPLLHGGALGVAAEARFPTDLFKRNIAEAKERIAKIAGKANVPTGFYAFMDSDLRTALSENQPIWQAAEEAGMRYFVTCSNPGRPRVMRRTEKGVVINQTYRVLEAFSPFVRISADTDVVWGRSGGAGGPGWRIGVLDASVTAFTPYIWEKGSRFLQLVEGLKTGANGGQYVNVKPRVIARYAKILAER